MNCHRHPSFTVLLILGLALAPAVSALGADAPPEDAGPSPTPVRVGLVRMQAVQQKRTVSGRIDPIRRSIVASEESGRVVLSPPDPGTPVVAGQVLAQLDDEIMRIERKGAAGAVAEARGLVDQRQALLNNATRDRKRIEELARLGNAKQKELDDAGDMQAAARAALNQAQGVLEVNEARLAELDARLRKLKIVAPFDAQVIAKHTEVGQWLAPGNPVVELIATDRVDAVLDVPEFIVGRIPLDQPITVTVGAIGQQRTGPVYRLVPDADRTSRTFPVLIRLDNPDGALRSGMTVSSELPIGTQMQALTIPRDAVNLTPTGTLVYAHRGGVALPVNVVILFGAGDRFVVNAPLGPGEQVVVEGNERLFPGQPLQVLNPPTDPEPAPANPNP